MRKSKIEGVKLTEEQKKMVEANHGLILYVLKMKKLPFDEYYDIAAIALCKAAILYDPTISNFSTYACNCISNSIGNYWTVENAKKREGNKTALYYEDLINKYDEIDSPGTILESLRSPFNTENEALCKIAYENAFNKLTKKSQVIFQDIMKYGTTETAKRIGRTRARVGMVYTDFKKAFIAELPA